MQISRFSRLLIGWGALCLSLAACGTEHAVSPSAHQSAQGTKACPSDTLRSIYQREHMTAPKDATVLSCANGDFDDQDSSYLSFSGSPQVAQQFLSTYGITVSPVAPGVQAIAARNQDWPIGNLPTVGGGLQGGHGQFEGSDRVFQITVDQRQTDVFTVYLYMFTM